MTFSTTSLQGSFVIDLDPFSDDRGWFARYYCKDEFLKIDHTKEWVQMNHSTSFRKGTLRGMHFQAAPYSEIKMVRCIAGSVFDVIIDIRKNSASFLKWFGVELSAENRRMIYIPAGFAHGFQCLSDNCELLYHHTEFYKPMAEGGIRHNDPLINIQWPLSVTVVSQRDASHPLLDEKFNGF